MVKTMGRLSDRLVSLIAPKSHASACICWYLDCELPDGTIYQRECCKKLGHLYCDPCGG